MDQIEIINSDRIRPIIEAGIAEKIDISFCEKFDKYLCSEYPWERYSGRINWIKVKHPYKRFKWDTATIEETSTFLKTTCLKNYKEVCVIYEPDLPGLIVDFDYACKELENLTIFGWATRFVVAVKKNKIGKIELVQECFVEVDFSDWLTASC